MQPEKSNRRFRFDEIFSRLETRFNLTQGVIGEFATRELRALSDDWQTLKDRTMIFHGLERIRARLRHRKMATKPKAQNPPPKI
jgi:hypothetical protein